MSNGKIIGAANPPTIVSAPGVWNLNDVHSSRKTGTWPRSPSTLTFRTSTTGSGTTTALTLTHPVGVTTGDLCVLFHYMWDNDDDHIINAPSGFTILHGRAYEYTTTTFLSNIISYRVLPNTTNVTLPLAIQGSDSLGTNPDNQAYVALYFYLDKTIENVNLLQASYAQSTADPAARSITATNFSNVPLLVLGSEAIITGTPAFNASTTPSFDGTVTNTGATNIEMIVGYKIYSSNPASDHTIDMDEISVGAAKQLTALLLSVQ